MSQDRRRMVLAARAVADYAYRHGIGDAIAIDDLIAENERLKQLLDQRDHDAADAENDAERLREQLAAVRAAQREATIRHAAEWLRTLGRDDMATALVHALSVTNKAR